MIRLLPAACALRLGSKLWHFKYRIAGSEKKLSFGAYPEVTLKAARTKRDEARAMLADNEHPSRIRRAKKLKAQVEATNTFGEFIGREKAKGRAEPTIDKLEWFRPLLEPRLGRMPVVDISAPVLLTVLTEVEKSGRRETAKGSGSV